MKTFKTVLFAFILFLSANTISAQYGNGYGGGGYGGGGYGGGGYGGGYGGNGYGRSNQMSQMGQNSQQSAPKPVPVEKTAAKIVEYYKKELNLDALQEVVVNNVYVKSLKKQEAIIAKKETSDEDKIKEITVLNDMTDLEIIDVLNKDQKEKYKILMEDRKSKQEARKH